MLSHKDNQPKNGNLRPVHEKQRGRMPLNHEGSPRNNTGNRGTEPPDSSSDSDGHQPTHGAGFHPLGVRPHEYYLREDRW